MVSNGNLHPYNAVRVPDVDATFTWNKGVFDLVVTIKDVKLFNIGVDINFVARKDTTTGGSWDVFFFAGLTDINDGWLEFPPPWMWLSSLIMIPIDVAGGKLTHLGFTWANKVRRCKPDPGLKAPGFKP